METILLPNQAEWQDSLGMNNSSEAMEWVNEHLLSNEDETARTYETVDRPNGLQPLTRIKTQTYTAEGYTLLVSRTYPTVMSCAGVTATYNLTNNE